MKLGTLRLSGVQCTSRAVIGLILLLATAVPIVARGDGPTNSPPVYVVGKPDCGYYGKYAVTSQGHFVDCESAGQLFGPGNSGIGGAVGAPYGGDGGGAGSPATDNQNRNPKNNDCHTSDGDPVIVTTGNKVEAFTDFSGTGEMPLTLTRTYSSNSNGGILFTPTGLGKHVVWHDAAIVESTMRVPVNDVHEVCTHCHSDYLCDRGCIFARAPYWELIFCSQNWRGVHNLSYHLGCIVFVNLCRL